MNFGERIIDNTLSGLGYTVLHTGAPDFLCFYGDPRKGLVKNIVFIEVKSDKAPEPTEEQWIWILVLKQIGCNVVLFNPNDNVSYKQVVKYTTLENLEER